jgi:Uma2 family endonuclease
MAQQNTLAPWAELVPDIGPMTVDELLALPDDGWMYELVEGRLVRMPPTGGGHGGVASELCAALRNWVKPRGLGRVLAAETGFQLGAGTVLAPDVAYVRAERLPARDSASWESSGHWRLTWWLRWPRRATHRSSWRPKRGRGLPRVYA